MLQQIIKEMYIEPDLLAELSEEQKQLIFIKIREEQVRRWKEFENSTDKQSPVISLPKRNGKPKHVDFLLGADENVWVWVMGEHSKDKSIDNILEGEARAKASEKAEKEAEALREKEEREAEQKLREEEKHLEMERLEQERRLAAAAAAAKKKEAENAQRLAQTEREAVKARQEMAKFKLVESDAPIKEKSEKARLIREESYRVLKEQRTSEILSAFQKTKLLWEQKATEDGKKLDQVWQQQEKKAKQAETKQKLIVKGAREDYKRNSMLRSGEEVKVRPTRASRKVFRESVVLLTNVQTAVRPSMVDKPRPSSKDQIEKWFKEEEKPKSVGLTQSGTVEPWFHGLITREEAESLLSDVVEHSFLVRVSEKIWGYAISYKAEDRCKHYLIDTTDNGGYQFFGTNQLEHSSLAKLLQYHKNHPISTAGQELLKFCVGQTKTPPDYASLFPELLESTSL